MGGNLREARGIDSEVAFFKRDPGDRRINADGRYHGRLRLPCDNSNDLESRTTDVQRRLRSLEAVSNCFPSFA